MGKRRTHPFSPGGIRTHALTYTLTQRYTHTQTHTLTHTDTGFPAIGDRSYHRARLSSDLSYRKSYLSSGTSPWYQQASTWGQMMRHICFHRVVDDCDVLVHLQNSSIT
eukprot:GHVU01047548.1.p1 GENE.GHVU01047548.1~~GHVU01047548.1.p1  ORF type:complete len:109 (-),score=0.22 GHVU01047548.1:384-710(-)